MPELNDILLIVLVILAAFISVAAVVLLVRSKTGGDFHADFSRIEKQIRDEFTSQGKEVTTTIYDSLLAFNERVNLKLSENADKASGSIADFRVNVNRELADFQEKINARLTAEFRIMAESVEKQMVAINSKVEERLKQGFVETTQTFTQIAARIQVIDEAQKNIQDLSKQMISLEGILTNNQSRGAFGEYQLEKLLFSVFGEHKNLYETQYTIREEKGKAERVRADAVVHIPPAGLIAIDSKFPFANYARLFTAEPLLREEEDKTIQALGADIKKHITAIAAKYIISGRTLDHALMFVASDGILALIHSRLSNVIDYAYEKHVTIVSPTTLVPLLSSYFAVTIDYQRTIYAAQIKKELDALTKEFGRFADDWDKLYANIDKLGRQSGDVNQRVGKITNRFGQIEKIGFPDDATVEAPDSAEITETNE